MEQKNQNENLENQEEFADESEKWEAYRKESQKRRWDNFKKSCEILDRERISYHMLDEKGGHLRIGRFDFWPTTGKFYDPHKKEVGRGIFNLLKIIKGDRKSLDRQISFLTEKFHLQYNDLTDTEKKISLEVRNAWNFVGTCPGYHEKQKERLKEEWPTLFRAINGIFFRCKKNN